MINHDGLQGMIKMQVHYWLQDIEEWLQREETVTELGDLIVPLTLWQEYKLLILKVLFFDLSVSKDLVLCYLA